MTFEQLLKRIGAPSETDRARLLGVLEQLASVDVEALHAELVQLNREIAAKFAAALLETDPDATIH